MSPAKGWQVTLVWIAACGATSLAQSKAIVLDAPPNTPARDTPGLLTTLARQSYNYEDYVHSVYVERTYGILSWSAATKANYEQVAARRGMESFRELSANDAREQVNGDGASDSFGTGISQRNRTTGIADVWITLLTICGLAAYQLRRKQQLLKRLPFPP